MNFIMKKSLFTRSNYLVGIVILLKLVLLYIFYSGFQSKLFVPFVDYFVETLNDPWDYFFTQNKLDIFPYNPGMLYILAPFQVIYKFLGFESFQFQVFLMKIPIFISDIIILGVLLKLNINEKRITFLYYFLSPIVLFAAYIHSQLDLIPTAVLLLSIHHILKKKLIIAGVLMGLAIGIKYHVIISLPIILYYMYRNNGIKNLIIYSIAVFFSILLIILPFINSTGLYQIVILNSKQGLLYDSFLRLGELKLYLPFFFAGLFTLFYFQYKKINRDLFIAFLIIIFSILLITVQPSPGWYLWIIPFITIFLIKHHNRANYNFFLFYIINFVIAIYFVLFYDEGYANIIFLGKTINLGIDHDIFRNIYFTGIEVILIVQVYFIFLWAIKSNRLYSRISAFTIGIAGNSASGKTSVVNDLKRLLKSKLLHLEGDGDHKWERGNENWQSMTHLNPKANFLHRQAENILSLKSGKKVLRTDYDHDTGTFTDEKIVKSNDFIVLSGLHTLYLPIMRKAVDLKVFLEPDQDLMTHWKIIRDIQERGYEKESVIKHIKERETETQKYIVPQKEFSDLIVHYFSKKTIEIGDPEIVINLSLKLTFDSSLNIDPVLDILRANRINCYHDYSKDLNNQYIVLENEPDKAVIKQCSRKIVENIDELIDKPDWEDGFKGFVQLFLLILISEKLKRIDEKD
jgi:uridine kinase